MIKSNAEKQGKSRLVMRPPFYKNAWKCGNKLKATVNETTGSNKKVTDQKKLFSKLHV